MRDYFRFYFGNSGLSAKEEGRPFHSLYSFAATFGFNVYQIMFIVVILLIMIMTGIAFVKGYMANDTKGRAENKDKIMRNVLILIFTLSLGALISAIYTIFNWTT